MSDPLEKPAKKLQWWWLTLSAGFLLAVVFGIVAVSGEIQEGRSEPKDVILVGTVGSICAGLVLGFLFTASTYLILQIKKRGFWR